MDNCVTFCKKSDSVDDINLYVIHKHVDSWTHVPITISW